MVSKPHTPNAIVDTRNSREPRLASSDAANVEDVMAKVIEFYIPDRFSRKVSTAQGERGKVIEFRLPHVKGPVSQFREPGPREPDTKAGAIPMWCFCI
jgi:hypothetical protein